MGDPMHNGIVLLVIIPCIARYFRVMVEFFIVISKHRYIELWYHHKYHVANSKDVIMPMSYIAKPNVITYKSLASDNGA